MELLGEGAYGKVRGKRALQPAKGMSLQNDVYAMMYTGTVPTYARMCWWGCAAGTWHGWCMKGDGGCQGWSKLPGPGG